MGFVVVITNIIINDHPNKPKLYNFKFIRHLSGYPTYIFNNYYGNCINLNSNAGYYMVKNNCYVVNVMIGNCLAPLMENDGYYFTGSIVDVLFDVTERKIIK